MDEIRGAVRSATVVAVLLAAVAAGPLVGVAHSLCDANGDGVISVSDGVQVLRAAAQLPSLCNLDACDANGDGAITVGDGVNVLRAAASLASDCDHRVTPTPTPTPTGSIEGCAPYSVACEATGAITFSASGGRLCGNMTNNRDVELDFRSAIGVDLEPFSFSSFILWDGVLGLIGFENQTQQPDGSILLESPDGGDVTAFCADDPITRFSWRSLHHRVIVTKVCEVGEGGFVIGSFDGLFLATDGSTCELNGQFKMVRVH